MKKKIQLLPSMSQLLFCKRDERPFSSQNTSLPKFPSPSFSFVCFFIICSWLHPVHVMFHFLLSCPILLHLHLNYSEFRRRIPLQCENTMIQCNLPQRMRIMAGLTCQGASGQTELQAPFEQNHPNPVLHVNLINPWSLIANVFKNTHNVSIMQIWPEYKKWIR